jgi:inositol phosphorylceramide mannosyltransferase catalytic subunit
MNTLSEMINSEIHIPRIIHQTYKTRDLPEHWRQTPDSWKRHHPNWKYIFWDDKKCRALVAKFFPKFLNIFDNYPYPIQRADAVRYIMLYVFGGLYADLDMMAKKPVDDLFCNDAEVYLLTTPNTGIVTNCFMASKRGSEFWKYVLKTMKTIANNPNPLWVTKHMIVMNTTGPSMLQQAYENYIREQASPLIYILPQTYIFPEECNVCAPKPCTTVGSYITILPGSSWCGTDTEIFTFLYCNYGKLLALLGLAILFIYLQINIDHE